MTDKYLKNKKGFTLIELLIVIAIIGLLAVIVLVAINPAQQLARTRDAGRKSAISQLGHAMESYATTHYAEYAPDDGAGCTPGNWLGCLYESAEISLVPDGIDYSANFSARCTASIVNDTWCYDSSDDAGGEPVIVYSILESDSERSRCNTAPPTNEEAWFVYSTEHGRGGLVCSSSEPAAGGTWSFVN